MKAARLGERRKPYEFSIELCGLFKNTPSHQYATW